MRHEPPRNAASPPTSEFGNPNNLSHSIDLLRGLIEQLNENLHRAISISLPLLTTDPRDLPTPTAVEEKAFPASRHTYELRVLAAKLEFMNNLLYEFGSHIDT